MTAPPPTHQWHFFRAGGSDQVALERRADPLAINELYPALRAACACPVRGLEIDERTLRLKDSDGDDRIRVAEGRQIAASANGILSYLGKAGPPSSAVADSMRTARVFAEARFDGDSVMPVDGIDDAALHRFSDECAVFDAGWRESEANERALLPLGDATPVAVATSGVVQAKIDDVFARGRPAAYDARSIAVLDRREEEYLEVAAHDLSIIAPEVAGFTVGYGDNLMVGLRGVVRDQRGNDRDATIKKLPRTRSATVRRSGRPARSSCP